MTALPAHSQVLVSILVPLVSHFQFFTSVRKTRKHEKLRFWFYHLTPKDDLQNQVCIVNARIYQCYIFSLFYTTNTVGILFLCLHSMTSPGSRSLIDFLCFKDTWSKPQLYSFPENHNFLPGLSPVLQESYTRCVRSSVSWCMTSPRHPWRAHALPCTTISDTGHQHEGVLSCLV